MTVSKVSSQLKSFADLEAWKASRDVRQFVHHKIVTALPAEEKFRLTDQLVRASRSVTAYIAEGYGRFHFIDNAKVCSNARAKVEQIHELPTNQ